MYNYKTTSRLLKHPTTSWPKLCVGQWSDAALALRIVLLIGDAQVWLRLIIGFEIEAA